MQSNNSDAELCNKIAEVIKAHPEGITASDIAKIVNVSYNKVTKQILVLSFPPYTLAEETVSRNEIRYFMV